jgi:hypothetical protein
MPIADLRLPIKNRFSRYKLAIGNRKSKILWRRGWDSNPRYSFPYTAFPVLPVQPLLHLSKRIADYRLPICD